MDSLNRKQIQLLNPRNLKKMYIIDDIPGYKIAKIIGVSSLTIYSRLRENGFIRLKRALRHKQNENIS